MMRGGNSLKHGCDDHSDNHSIDFQLLVQECERIAQAQEPAQHAIIDMGVVSRYVTGMMDMLDAFIAVDGNRRNGVDMEAREQHHRYEYRQHNPG